MLVEQPLASSGTANDLEKSQFLGQTNIMQDRCIEGNLNMVKEDLGSHTLSAGREERYPKHGYLPIV